MDVKATSEAQGTPEASAGAEGSESPNETTVNTTETAQGAEQSGGEQEQTAWFSGLPEETHESLKGFEKAEDAVAAMKRGKDYFPLTEAPTLDIPDWMNPGEAGMTSFNTFLVDNGFTQQQAQALIKYQADALTEAQKVALDEGNTALENRWGANMEKNRGVAMKALTALDRRMEGRASESLKAMGLTERAETVEFLYEVGKLVGEHTLGSGSEGAAPDKPKSAEDDYADLYKTAKN